LCDSDFHLSGVALLPALFIVIGRDGMMDS
jgi:hypothetical protein